MKESQNTEWKEAWRDEYLKWLCGFANAEGGVLIIGRNDKGAPVGVKDAKKLLADLPNKIRDVLGIMADVRLVSEGETDLIEIHIDPYPNPISYKGEYHIRSGSTKQELKGAALDRFLLRKYGRTWDSVPVPQVTTRSLSKSALATFRRLARQSERMTAADLHGSPVKLLERLHLLEGTYLTRAALLLFHPDPEKFFVGAFVKVGYFREGADVVYHDVIQGDLFTQMETTLSLLRTKYLKAAITYRGIHRVETFAVPDAALREAVMNAVIHRDYAVGTPVQIRVYDDRLTIWNPGQLPPDWTLEKLRGEHASEPFNPQIASVFFRSGEIEAWGRGIERIYRACREARFPRPTIEHEAGGFWTRFPFSQEVIERLRGAALPDQPSDSEETPVKTRVKTRVKTPERILEVLRENPELTLAEVAVAIGKSLSAVERASAKLVKESRLRFVGPRKGGQWEILR